MDCAESSEGAGAHARTASTSSIQPARLPSSAPPYPSSALCLPRASSLTWPCHRPGSLRFAAEKCWRWGTAWEIDLQEVWDDHEKSSDHGGPGSGGDAGLRIFYLRTVWQASARPAQDSEECAAERRFPAPGARGVVRARKGGEASGERLHPAQGCAR